MGTAFTRNCLLLTRTPFEETETEGLCLGPYGVPKGGGGQFRMSDIPLYDLQGYLAHKEAHPPQDPAVGHSLPGALRGPRGLRRWRLLVRRYPCTAV